MHTHILDLQQARQAIGQKESQAHAAGIKHQVKAKKGARPRRSPSHMQKKVCACSGKKSEERNAKGCRLNVILIANLCVYLSGGGVFVCIETL